MADGRHFENRYIAISQRKIISDFDEILYTAADFELDERHVIKNEKSCIGQTPSWPWKSSQLLIHRPILFHHSNGKIKIIKTVHCNASVRQLDNAMHRTTDNVGCKSECSNYATSQWVLLLLCYYYC